MCPGMDFSPERGAGFTNGIDRGNNADCDGQEQHLSRRGVLFWLRRDGGRKCGVEVEPDAVSGGDNRQSDATGDDGVFDSSEHSHAAAISTAVVIVLLPGSQKCPGRCSVSAGGC
jgi:hypothetical protein